MIDIYDRWVCGKDILSDNKVSWRTLNIDSAMIHVERILSRYHTENVWDGNLTYVRGLRYPITCSRQRDAYKNNKNKQHIPWHPYLVIPLLRDMLEYYQYMHSLCPEYFVCNKLLANSTGYHVNPDDTSTDIILAYVPNITELDLQEMSSIFDKVYSDELRMLFTENPDAIYALEATTNIYRLISHMDIRAYRYLELIAFEEDVNVIARM